MPPQQRRIDRGRRIDLQLRTKVAGELRGARIAAGLSQATLATMSGMSQASISRVEAAQAPMTPLSTYSILFAMLGQTLVVNTFPDSSPARDAGHGRLLGRFARVLVPIVIMRTEVLLRRSVLVRSGDQRAWDAELALGRERCKVEAETVLYDVQALDRRIGSKMEDDGVDRVILLVADTRRNREVLRHHRLLLRSRFPLDSAEILAGLMAGRLPARGGIVVL